MALRTVPNTASRSAARLQPQGDWGGYVILPRGSHVLHVRLTGVLSPSVLDELTLSVRRMGSSGSSTFVLLDADRLTHIPVAVGMRLAEFAREWRSLGAVVLWVGLSPYLANLVLLAGAGKHFPSLRDMSSALTVVDSLVGLPPSVARERLEAWDIMRH